VLIIRHVPAESLSFLIGVESADRQVAHMSLWHAAARSIRAAYPQIVAHGEGGSALMRSDEQMPGTVTRAPVARVAARLGGRCWDLVLEANTTAGG
jgi:hypothetical protein